MAARGPDWAAWVDRLPALTSEVVALWQLRPESPWTHGYCSLVLPVRTPDGAAAMLKISFPDGESDERLALRRWSGDGRCDCSARTRTGGPLLLERLQPPISTGL